MKTKFLVIITVSIFLALVTFVVLMYLINLEIESQVFQDHIGAGAIDLDPNLSPSYAYDYQSSFFQFHMITVAGPIMLGVISLVLLVPYTILRIKKIPPRKYMLVITAAILIFFGFGSVQNGLQSLLILEHLEQENDWIILIGGLITIGMGMIFIIPGIIILKRAKLRIRR